MNHPPLRSLLEDLRPVEGWLAEEDVALFFAVDDATRSLGISGDAVEIGAYKGRSTVVLGFCIADGERLIVVDPFGKPAADDTVLAEQRSSYADLTRQAFDSNFSRFHQWTPRVIEDFSTNLSPQMLSTKARLVHVDGAHDFASVAHDIDLVLGMLVEGGVAVFDDALNKWVPGVAAAIWGAVQDQRLTPLMTTGKLWLCHPSWHKRLLEALETQLATSGEVQFSAETFGATRVLRVRALSATSGTSRFRKFRRLITPPLVPLALHRLRSIAKALLRWPIRSGAARLSG